jgi:hypothetical protein
MIDKVDEPIWIVVDAEFPAKVECYYTNYNDAFSHAAIMAKHNQKEYIVFVAVTGVKVNEITVTKYEEGCSIPF